MLRVNEKPLFFDRISGTKVTRCPRRILAIVPELQADEPTKTISLESVGTRLVRWAIVAARMTDSGHWLRSEFEGSTAEGHWSVLHELLTGRRSAYIVCPSVSEWLASCGGYAALTACKLWFPKYTQPDIPLDIDTSKESAGRPGFFTLNGPTEILSCRYRRTLLEIVAASNYGINDFGSLVGMYGGVTDAEPFDCDGPNRFRGGALIVANCLSQWYCGMIDRWKHHDCGVWKSTAAQLSRSFYRRKYATRAVVKHQHVDAHKLERAALYGGRADIYRVGEQRGSFHRLDIRSLYPSILASVPAPVALSAHGGSISLKYLSDAMRTHVVAARVTLATESDDYPLRWKPTPGKGFKLQTFGRLDDGAVMESQTLFPIGEFTTTLCGPELEHAVASGHVTAVHEHAIYRRSMEFAPMMVECMSRRTAARHAGDPIEADFWKLLSNSFSGQWARRAGGWVADERLPAVEAWHEWIQRHPDSGEYVRCRTFGFIPQWYEAKSDKPSACPIIFAWLTACGRRVLAEAVRVVSTAHCLQTDTDGLWVDDRGLEKLLLQPERWGDGPGKLRIVDTASNCQFWTPRHYHSNGRWIYAGFAKGWTINADGTVSDVSRRSVYPADSADGPSRTLIDYRRSDIRGMQDNHRATKPDGTTTPWRIDRVTGRLSNDFAAAQEPDDD